MDRFVTETWEGVVEEVRRHIGETGVEFFRSILNKFDDLHVVTPGPHPIHQLEGKIVRDVMYRASLGMWPSKDYDLYWVQVVVDAIKKDETLKAESKFRKIPNPQ